MLCNVLIKTFFLKPSGSSRIRVKDNESTFAVVTSISPYLCIGLKKTHSWYSNKALS